MKICIYIKSSQKQGRVIVKTCNVQRSTRVAKDEKKTITKNDILHTYIWKGKGKEKVTTLYTKLHLHFVYPMIVSSQPKPYQTWNTSSIPNSVQEFICSLYSICMLPSTPAALRRVSAVVQPYHSTFNRGLIQSDGITGLLSVSGGGSGKFSSASH